MAADLTLYVLADPVHAAILLENTEGSGFDSGHNVSDVMFRFRDDGPRRREMTALATEKDAGLEPLLAAMRSRAAASIAEIAPGRTVRGTNVPVTSLPNDRTKAMALADVALVQRGECDNIDMTVLIDRYLYRLFVIDAVAHGLLIGHARHVGTDVAPLRRVLDAGFGRVATILLD